MFRIKFEAHDPPRWAEAAWEGAADWSAHAEELCDMIVARAMRADNHPISVSLSVVGSGHPVRCYARVELIGTTKPNGPYGR